MSATLPMGEDGGFFKEFRSSLLKLLALPPCFFWKKSGAHFAAHAEMPIFGEDLRGTEAAFVRRDAPVAPVQEGRALPLITVFAAIDVDLAAHGFVGLSFRSKAFYGFVHAGFLIPYRNVYGQPN
jgi:hypothetical protein